MNLINHINLTNPKLQTLINATSTYKETGLLFLGEDSNNGYAIIDVLNFGFLTFFPILSNFFDINVANLVSYFFLFLFFSSLIFTLFSCYKLCVNKSKIIPLSILTFLIYFVIFQYVLKANAEYFIYFFWGLLPLTFYSIDKSDVKILAFYIFTVSLLIIILGSFLYYSYLGFIIFYLFAVYFEKIKYKKYLLIIPLISLFLLTFLQQYSIKYALNNLNKIENLNLNSNNQPRNIGNNVYVVFYAGLGYLNTDYFDSNFNDDEIYKLVGKTNPNLFKSSSAKYFSNINEGKIIDNGVNNLTKLTTKDIQLIKEKIVYFIINKPSFVLKVIFAKIGVLLGYFLIIGNFYLIYFFSSKVENYYKIPLIINLLISAAIPIVSIPSKLYSLTFLGASLSIFIFSYCKNKKII